MLFFNGHRCCSSADNREWLARSYDGGNTFVFDVNWNGLTLGSTRYGGGAFASVGTGSQLLTYQPNEATGDIHKLTSDNGGETWTDSVDIGYWGPWPTSVRYDVTRSIYIMAWDPPQIIARDCSVPTWKYPAISISGDGNSFSYVSVENYFGGDIILAAEASPLGDRRGKIQPYTPMILYLNDHEAADGGYGHSGTIYSVTWKEGTGDTCP